MLKLLQFFKKYEVKTLKTQYESGVKPPRCKGSDIPAYFLTTASHNTCYLSDVFNIKLDVKGEFDVVLGEDGLVRLTVPAQATEGASVAGPLFVSATKK